MMVDLTVSPPVKDSCVKRCNQVDYDNAVPCQCNVPCLYWGDCCDDYATVCYTCQGRCGSAPSKQWPCACDAGCLLLDSCCPDYDSLCYNHAGNSSTSHN